MIEKVLVPGLRPTVWDQTQQKVKYPKLLRKAVTDDVVVVGAGITGLTVAYNLVKEGKKVVVFESRVRGKIDRDDDQIWQQT
jgi:NADPH-dependent 2,4-dienoyl-CoA reductase/sulfur reductase-like enzyme